MQQIQETCHVDNKEYLLASWVNPLAGRVVSKMMDGGLGLSEIVVVPLIAKSVCCALKNH